MPKESTETAVQLAILATAREALQTHDAMLRSIFSNEIETLTKLYVHQTGQNRLAELRREKEARKP